jgi:hypothetical protein
MKKACRASLSILACSTGLLLAPPALGPVPFANAQPPAGPAGGYSEAIPLTTYDSAPQCASSSPNGIPSLDASTRTAWDPPEPCEPERLWFTAEYLYWWFHENLPPLITTSSVPGAPGIIGQPGTQVLFGGHETDAAEHSGARFTVTYWLEPLPVALEARLDFLGERSDRFAGGSDAAGNPVLSRPVVNTQTNAETVESISFPGQFAGTAKANMTSALYDAQANVILQLPGCYILPDLIVGFRYVDLEEDLGVSQNTTVLGLGLVGTPNGFAGPGTVVSIGDQFNTRNQFIGGNVGARACYSGDYFYCEVRGTAGLGYTHEAVTMLGSTSLTAPGGAPIGSSGGLLVLGSNTGRFTRDVFTVLPEVGVNAGWHVTRWLDVFMGYSFLYWPDVLRPGTGIDRTVNPSQLSTSSNGTGLVGPARPAELREKDFWAHGLNVGLTFRF